MTLSTVIEASWFLINLAVILTLWRQARGDF